MKFWIVLGQLHHFLLHSALGLLIVERRVIGIGVIIITRVGFRVRARIAVRLLLITVRAIAAIVAPDPVDSPLGHALEEGVDVHIGQVGLSRQILLVALPAAGLLLPLRGIGLPLLPGGEDLRIGVPAPALPPSSAADLALLGEGLVLVEHRLDAALGDELARTLGGFDHDVTVVLISDI